MNPQIANDIWLPPVYVVSNGSVIQIILSAPELSCVQSAPVLRPNGFSRVQVSKVGRVMSSGIVMMILGVYVPSTTKSCSGVKVKVNSTAVS